MPPISETGRAKNIANLRLLRGKLSLLSPGYNPSNPAITPASILGTYNTAKAALATFNAADATYKTAANTRKVAFVPLSKLLTRSRGAIGSSTLSGAAKKEALVDAGALIRKYRGIRATPIAPPVAPPAPPALPPADPESEHISAAHTSFVQKANTFQQIVEFYTTLGTAYAPDSADLSLTALNGLYNTLDNQNTIVGDAISARTYTRDLLRTIMDAPDTGLIDIALAAKEAVKEKFGAGSHEYRQVSGIIFTREREQ